MNFAELDAHPVPRGAALFWGIAAAAAAGVLLSSRHPAAIPVLLLLVVVTTLLPEVVPAILLVGPAALHMLTYMWAGFTTRGDVLTNPIAYLPLLLALFGPPLLVTFVWRRPVLRGSPLFRSGAARVLILGMSLLLVWLFLRLDTPSPIYAVTKIVGFFAFSLLPAVYLLLVVRNSLDAQRVLVAVLVIGGVWCALLIWAALARRNLDLYHTPLGDVVGGLNMVAGGIGARAGIIAVVAAGCILAGDKNLRRLGFAVLPFAAVALILSGHRSSLFAALAGLAVLLFLFFFWMRKAQIGTAVVALAAVVVLGAGLLFLAHSGVLGARFKDPLSSLSFGYRLHSQQVALSAWWNYSPITGTGTGSSNWWLGFGDQPKLGVIGGQYPHNVIIELLVEVGVVGAAIYLLTIFEAARRATKVLWRAGQQKWPLATLVALFAAAFVASQAGADLTIQNDLWLIGALMAATTVAAGAEPAPQLSEPTANRRRVGSLTESV